MHATTLIVALERPQWSKEIQGEKEATNIMNSAELPSERGLKVLSIVDHAEHSVKRVGV
jgi:hypothetical protein